jgi:hypothetical protein
MHHLISTPLASGMSCSSSQVSCTLVHYTSIVASGSQAVLPFASRDTPGGWHRFVTTCRRFLSRLPHLNTQPSAVASVQTCIRSLFEGSQVKYTLNEKLCRFWMQNCGKLINEMPSCIAAMGDQVWATAHQLYAVVSVAPAMCAPTGEPMPPEQRQLLLASLCQHLLPRIQVCAEQALNYMLESSIQQKLMTLARCGKIHLWYKRIHFSLSLNFVSVFFHWNVRKYATYHRSK